MTSCVKGIAVISVFALAVAYTGCSSLHDTGHNIKGSLPPSHTVVAGRALDEALTNLSLPPGNGESMKWAQTGHDPLSLLPVHGAEYLIGRGYKLTAADSTALKCVITVDTLYISLGSRSDDGRSQRFAEARLTAEITSPDNDRTVYKASGSHEDTLDDRSMDIFDDVHPLVDRPKGIVHVLKPVLYGFTVTALVWFLYSYRG